MPHSYINVQISFITGVLGSLTDNIRLFFWNGKRNLFIYFEDMEKQKKHNEESIKNLIETIEKDLPVILYAKTHDTFVKIEVTKEQFNVYPLEPYCMKQGIDASEPQLDLDTYIKIALGFCENFAIYSLETKHLEL